MCYMYMCVYIHAHLQMRLLHVPHVHMNELYMYVCVTCVRVYTHAHVQMHPLHISQHRHSTDMSRHNTDMSRHSTDISRHSTDISPELALCLRKQLQQSMGVGLSPVEEWASGGVGGPPISVGAPAAPPTTPEVAVAGRLDRGGGRGAGLPALNLAHSLQQVSHSLQHGSIVEALSLQLNAGMLALQKRGRERSAGGGGEGGEGAKGRGGSSRSRDKAVALQHVDTLHQESVSAPSSSGLISIQVHIHKSQLYSYLIQVI